MKNKYDKTEITIGYANSLRPKDKRYFVSDKLPGLCLKVETLGLLLQSQGKIGS